MKGGESAGPKEYRSERDWWAGLVEGGQRNEVGEEEIGGDVGRRR